MAFKALKNLLGTVLGYLQEDAAERLGLHNFLHVRESQPAGTEGGSFASGAR